MRAAGPLAAGLVAAILGSERASALRVEQERVSFGPSGHHKKDSGPDLSSALECLRKTTPHLKLEYPADAEQHVAEIRNAMLPWSHGFVGSYHVEDILNLGFADRWFNRTDKSDKLSDIFGPYIPIFAQWVDPWLRNTEKRLHYPSGFVDALKKVLRKNVPYVALSQNDEGITGKNEIRLKEFPNLLVMSAGGYGHIAVPLAQTQGHTISRAMWMFDKDVSIPRKRVPVSQRKYFISYVGGLDHSPRQMRPRMKDEVQRYAAVHGILDKVMFNRTGSKKDRSWEDVMFNSRFSLTPRGYGRTSYHLMEAIQRGVIPIHVYTDMPWVPYPEVFKTFGYTTTVDGLPSLLQKLRAMSDRDIEQLEKEVARHAKSHFTLEAVRAQIAAFFVGGKNDLVCQRLPDTLTDKDY